MKIFARASWSWSKIAFVIAFTVSTFGWSLIGPPEVVCRWPDDRTKARCARASGEPTIFAEHRDSDVLPMAAGEGFRASPDAPTAGRFVRSHQSRRTKERPT